MSTTEAILQALAQRMSAATAPAFPEGATAADGWRQALALAAELVEHAQAAAKFEAGGMTKTQLDGLDKLVRRWRGGHSDALDGLSTGERLYVALAGSHVLTGWTIAGALHRLGDADTAALVERWYRER